MKKILPLLAFALISLCAAGCTPAARTDTNTALNGIGTGAAVASGACTLLLAGSAGTVCGTVATDVSAVAKMVEAILASLPPAEANSIPGMAEITYRGVRITVSARVADQVRAALPGAS